METQKENKNITYIISKHDKEAKEEISKILKKPLAIQKFLYVKYKIPRYFNSTMVVEDDERISVVSNTFNVMMGNNGLFVKASNSPNGVRYDKKGKANARLNIWNKGNYSARCIDELKVICNKVSPNNTYLFDDKIIKEVGTKIENKQDLLNYLNEV